MTGQDKAVQLSLMLVMLVVTNDLLLIDVSATAGAASTRAYLLQLPFAFVRMPGTGCMDSCRQCIAMLQQCAACSSAAMLTSHHSAPCSAAQQFP